MINHESTFIVVEVISDVEGQQRLSTHHVDSHRHMLTHFVRWEYISNSHRELDRCTS
jgi:hypothetical protein